MRIAPVFIVTVAIVTLTLAANVCVAQTLPSDQASTSDAPAAPATDEATAGLDHRWSFSTTLFTYFVPNDHEYLQPTITADRDWLHLEARYNYEDQNTASVWVGYNFSGGDELAWEITPMLGGVFGDTTGVAPGYKGSLTWKKLELYSEGEYLIDADNASASYFYDWSELTYSPVEWFRFGLVAQHTRLYKSDRDIQSGLLVGFTWEKLDLAAYVLNPDDGEPIIALAVRFDF